jgi:hypothetical protein
MLSSIYRLSLNSSLIGPVAKRSGFEHQLRAGFRLVIEERFGSPSKND